MEFLAKNFGWVPILGEYFKTAYKVQKITQKVQRLVEAQRNGTFWTEVEKMSETEAEKFIRKQADEQYEEHIASEIREQGIPTMMADKIKDRAINELVKAMKEEYNKRRKPAAA